MSRPRRRADDRAAGMLAWAYTDPPPCGAWPDPAGFDTIRIDGAGTSLDGAARVDLGGIAKDTRRSAREAKRGVRSAWIDLGAGRTLGAARGALAPGIRTPPGLLRGAPMGRRRFHLGRCRAYVEDDQTGHVIDPHTGRPPTARQATVVARRRCCRRPLHGGRRLGEARPLAAPAPGAPCWGFRRRTTQTHDDSGSRVEEER
jgi:hypothetical protein